MFILMHSYFPRHYVSSSLISPIYDVHNTTVQCQETRNQPQRSVITTFIVFMVPRQLYLWDPQKTRANPQKTRSAIRKDRFSKRFGKKSTFANPQKTRILAVETRKNPSKNMGFDSFWGSWHNVLPYVFQAFLACLIASNVVVAIDETFLTM